jgi:hypothetical protein
MALPAAHAGVAAIDRYATPTGSDTASCWKIEPCSITTAINDAPPSSHVSIGPGVYGSAQDPISTELTNNGPVTIEATKPKHPPVIYSNSGDHAILLYQATVSHLILVSHAGTDGLALFDHSYGHHIAVYDSTAGYGACSVYDSTLADSLCSETGFGQPSIGMSTGGTGASDSALVNVTAVATGKHSRGLAVSASGGINFNVTVTNSVIRGTENDVLATSSEGTTTISLAHSDFRGTKSTASGTAKIKSRKTNISAAPVFINPPAGNFGEKASSPTVNRGVNGPTPDTDLAGSPRILGGKVDIGAYEFRQRPAVRHLTLVKVTDHSATFTARVNPEGLVTRSRLVATANQGSQRAVSEPVKITQGGKTVKLTVDGLKPAHGYRVRLRAHNGAGVTVSAGRHITTQP